MAAGQWGTITIQAPDFIADVRDAINSSAQFLVTVLDIVLSALQLVKSFLVGYIDPIMAFLQQVIDYLNSLLKDLRQLGIYMCGDWKQLKYPYQDLRGGYPAYEQRMIARMTDRTDPTRPDITANTKVFSLWFYLSVDISSIERLINFVRQLMQFFGHKFIPEGSPPVPTITKVLYNSEGASILQPQALGEYFTKSLELPSVAVVKWKVNSTASENTFNPFPSLPPEGFIVSVSTLQNGIPLFFDRPQVAAGTKTSSAGEDVKVQPRDYGTVVGLSGQPAVLFGGTDQVINLNFYSYNESLEMVNGKSVVKPNRTRVYGVLSPSDRTLIPLEALDAFEGHNFQRFFYVPISMVGTQFMTGEFQFTLPLKDMPRAGTMEAQPDGTMAFKISEEHATTVYVRVASCTKAIGLGDPAYRYDFMDLSSKPSPTAKIWKVNTPGVGLDDVSPFSNPMRVTFPNANTREYFKAVQTAMIVLALCRPDLETLEERISSLPRETQLAIQKNLLILKNVAALPCGLEPFKHLLGYIFKDPSTAFSIKNGLPGIFRNELFNKAKQFAYDAYNATGPMPDLEKSVVQGTQFLRTAKWGALLASAGVIDEAVQGVDPTILDSIDPDQPYGAKISNGIAINRYSMGLTEAQSDSLLDAEGVFQLRTPQFMEAPLNPANDPTFSDAVTFADTNALLAARNACPALRPFYDQAKQVEDGSWVIPSKVANVLYALKEQGGMRGSCDDGAPVFYLGKTDLQKTPPKGKVIFCRGLFAAVNNGQILSEALFALSAAASAMHRSPKDGQWLTYKLMDSLTGIEDFMWSLQNWMESIRNTMQSIVDTIVKYIEFLEGRIIEMQQFIRRINDLIQSMMGNIFSVPKCSAMMLYSNGTGGMLSDFVSAKYKPSDSPLAFGAGVGVVFPVPLVGLIGDILLAIFNTDAEATDGIAGPLPPAAVIPNPPVAVDPVEPDVL